MDKQNMMEHHWIIKKNKLLIDATSCMNLKNIIPRERSQRLRDHRLMIPFICNIQKGLIFKRQVVD